MMNSRYAVVLAAAAALSWEPAVHAQSVTPGTTITLEGATKMVRACETFAREKGLVVSVWVIDAAGTPIYMRRMEGSILRAVDFAFWKAETAIIWEGSTDPHNTDSLLGRVFVFRPGGESVLDRTGALLSGGGLPVRVNGVIVGAVGVGGAGTDDETCAQAAVDALAQ